MKDIRIGIVGKRGAAGIGGLRSVPGVKVEALCELDPAALEREGEAHGIEKRFTSYTELLDHVDAVVLGTPMQLHASQAVEALKAGKHVLSEVTACVSLEECWQLLDAVEESGLCYMLAENYCYFEENILVREMVKRGLFGRVYFGEGEYVHEVRSYHYHPDGTPTWRAKWQVGIRGNTYITHELGPVMQWFHEQDPQDRITSVSCMGSGVHSDPRHIHDDTCLTLVQLASGALLKMRIDMLSNTPGHTFYSLQGTGGTYQSGLGCPARVYLGENKAQTHDSGPRVWTPLTDHKDLLPSDWKVHLEDAGQYGHGGGDYHVGRLFAEAIRDGSPPPIGIHEALEWTAAGLCSQISIEQGGAPVALPNFRTREMFNGL